MATIHLVSLGELDEVPNAYYLDEEYPGITDVMKRGDIIENVSESGYRSQGVYMWNGTNVIQQNTDWDDYGSPSKEFKVVTEFPPGYWDVNTIEKVENWVGAECTTKFYWHSEFTPCALDVKKLGLDRAIVHSEEIDAPWRNRIRYWITFVWDSTEYILNLDYDEPDYIEKYMEPDGLIPVYWYDGQLHTSF